MHRAVAALALWFAAAPASAGSIAAVEIASGLALPTYVTAAPGDDTRLFYLEQHTGRIRILDTATGQVLPDPFLTVPSITAGSEQGLLGLAFHPDYAHNGYFFVDRTDASGNTQIERYQVSPTDPNVALPTPTTLLSITQPQANHNGGWLGFGPDGYLYASSGDGGAANDTGTGHTTGIGNGQDLANNLLGKILRLDVDSPPPPGQKVAIPASNPFVGIAGDDRVWAYGLRNPWRASFDRQTGDFYIGDVGQNAVEEIDVQPASSRGGENYGWRLREGTGPTPGGVGGPKPAGAIDPIYQYLHQGGGRSVIGGYVYRGPIAELQGQYFFGDSVTGQVWSIVFDGSKPADFDATNFTSFKDWTQELGGPVGGFGTISSFGEDNQGNVYLVALGNPFSNEPTGRIFKLTEVPEPATALLLALGLMTFRARRPTQVGRRAARRSRAKAGSPSASE